MSVFFGTDGLRGIIGDDLTHEIAYNCGNALGKIFPSSNILLGKDTRVSGDYIATSFASGLISAGCNITIIGICPTPGVAYLTHTLGFDYGVVITASHNPLDHNGIKIFDNNFSKIPDTKEEQIEKNFFRHILTSNAELGQLRYEKDYTTIYENFLKETTDSAFWKASYDLKDGEFTKTPVESAFGYHIILKISSKEKPSLEDSKDKVTEELVSQKISSDSKLIAKTWANIREKYNLNIVETTMKNDYETTINSLKSAS